VSEFSSSLHIRTLDAEDTEKVLMKAGYRGLVFGPRNGWLTFVPYADGNPAIDQVPDFAPKLSEKARSTVLHYTYAEDHFWSFAIFDAGQAGCMFACGWDPKLEVDRERLDIMAVQALVPSKDIEPFLQNRTYEGYPSAYRFCEALGLPEYQWLSPLLVENDTPHFLKRGGRRLGRRKLQKKTRPPEPIELTTPKGDLSAREALEIVRAHAPFLDACWVLYLVQGSAHRGIDRTKPAAVQSDWQLVFLNEKTGERMNVQLFVKESSGRMVFNSFNGPPEAGLPTNWIDSSQAVEIVSLFEIPKELERADIRALVLQRRTPGAIWKVWRGHYRISWSIEIDALTGEVLREAVGWADEGDNAVYDRRERLRGGAWRDIPR
jgi:hypothetical protein